MVADVDFVLYADAFFHFLDYRGQITRTPKNVFMDSVLICVYEVLFYEMFTKSGYRVKETSPM